VGIAGVFWVTGAMVGAGSRLAWLLKSSLNGAAAGTPVPGPKA
jgi:hypothetical protein